MQRIFSHRQFLPYIAVVIFLAVAATAAAANGVDGYWKTKDGAIVLVHPCGANTCLRIVKLSPTVPEKMDNRNPDKSKRSRPLCRLDIGTGFKRADASHLTDGHLYDPESGHTYSGTIVSEGDEMRLRGYIGISLFGRTEIWRRASGVAESDCK